MMDINREFRGQNKNTVSSINPLFKKEDERLKIAEKSKEMDI
jgi:hypothetical protein